MLTLFDEITNAFPDISGNNGQYKLALAKVFELKEYPQHSKILEYLKAMNKHLNNEDLESGLAPNKIMPTVIAMEAELKALEQELYIKPPHSSMVIGNDEEFVWLYKTTAYPCVKGTENYCVVVWKVEEEDESIRIYITFDHNKKTVDLSTLTICLNPDNLLVSVLNQLEHAEKCLLIELLRAEVISGAIRGLTQLQESSRASSNKQVITNEKLVSGILSNLKFIEDALDIAILNKASAVHRTGQNGKLEPLTVKQLFKEAKVKLRLLR